MKTHLQEIQFHCQRLNRRHFLLAGALCLMDWAITWALVAAWDAYLDPIREQTAAILLLILIPLVGGLWIWGFLTNRDLFHLDARRMARRVENSNTQLNDLLVTAADLGERNNDAPNALEQHVLDSAADQLGAFDWRSASTRWPERWRTVVIAWLIALLMAGAMLYTPAMKKAGHFLEDWISGSPSGLTVREFPHEVPVGTDVTVGLAVHRWERLPRIHWSDSVGSHVEPVVVDVSGSGEFTFYAMENPIHFKFTTPSLESSWYAIMVYEPARLDAVDIEIRPPAYTRLDPIKHGQLSDLSVPEGSEVSIRLQSQAAEAIELRTDETAYTVSPGEPGNFTLSFNPTQSGPFRFLLTDSEKREEMSPVRELRIVPDLAPTVEILAPEQDKVLAPDQEFLLHVYSADDYGLANAQVHLKLSNSDETVLGLPLKDSEEPVGSPLLESEIRAGISLEQLGASDGEFLALHVEVTDNREPLPNRTRSDLLFIEIRTPIPPEEQDGMPMEQKEINLRELIDEQKRILRETYRLEILPPEEKANRLPELISSLSALGVEINRLFTEIRPDLEAAGRTDLIELFKQADLSNRQAIGELEAGLPGDSFEPQSTSLSSLLKLENAFRTNTISKNPSEGKGGQGQSESQSEESGEEGEQGANQDLDTLLEAKESLESAIAEQNRLNSGYDRAARSEWSEADAAADAEDQRALAEQSGELGDALSQVSESGRLRSMLHNARGHMTKAAMDASGKDAAGSLRSGLRARESLRRAAAELDTMIAEASGQQLAAAAQAAAQLARRQAEAATASQNAAGSRPSQDELASMEARQRALQERYENFLEALEAQARASASFSPAASQSLMAAAGEARSQSTGSDMERAANALLYGQPGMAASLQSSAAEQLASLSESLSGAREQLGNNPLARARALNRELMAALEELASYAREPDAADQERLEDIRDNWSRRLEELREISGDPRFGGLSGQLGRTNPGAGPEQLADARMILQQGARVLHEFLFNEATFSGMQINREAAPPPDEYRRMVEEYFRRLANEPTTTP